ncbi:MAG: hypothetical protein QXO75_09265 [Nitrososphaerota archaeon]
MMIRRAYNVPKVIPHPVVSTHPLIASPTKGSIQPVHGVPNYPWLKKGTGPLIGPHPIGPISGTIPITPGNILRPPGFPTKYITPYHPITPITPYHPIMPYHPITITPIHPTQIVQQKVQKTTTPLPPSQPDTSGVIGAGIGALMSLFVALI